jgi:2-succinyl-6-hydroxy-2,4-cyclohexadiene-1-carboxylate synthase
VSTTAGISNEAERAERARTDEALAQRIESIGTEAFLEEWTSQPMFFGTTIDEADRRGRLTNSPASLAHSLRSCGVAAQTSLWDRLSPLQLPTLIVVGERDAKFVGLGKRLHNSIDGSEFVVIHDAGHAAHLDQPSRFTEVVTDFILRRVSA